MHGMYIYPFSVVCTGDTVVHSNGRLIPHEFPITDLQQISGPDGIGRINCTVSSGRAWFFAFYDFRQSDGVSQTGNGATSTLVVNPTDVANFNNRDMHCNFQAIYFYLFLSSKSKWPNNANTIARKEFDVNAQLHILKP